MDRPERDSAAFHQRHQFRSLGDEIREFVKDQCESGPGPFPGLRLLRGVAQKCVPGDCNFLCRDPLGGERRNQGGVSAIILYATDS